MTLLNPYWTKRSQAFVYFGSYTFAISKSGSIPADVLETSRTDEVLRRSNSVDTSTYCPSTNTGVLFFAA